MSQPFALDKADGKLMGVCAGLARSTGADLTLIRVLAVVSIFALGGVVIPLYLLTGLIAPQGR
ncbi:MAG: PspC domain-containing protein [Allosphingosinicella sp.]